MEDGSLPSDLGQLLGSVVLINASDIQPQEVGPSFFPVNWLARLPNKMLKLVEAEVLRTNSWNRPVNTFDLDRFGMPVFFNLPKARDSKIVTPPSVRNGIIFRLNIIAILTARLPFLRCHAGNMEESTRPFPKAFIF